ncbi:MAG: type II toxin-antitoxin system VapB family antitoxin [Acidimicrobiales bacterium]
MRTTVNIDDHLLAEAKAIAARSHRSLSDVVDDALRVMLAARTTGSGPSVPVTLPTAGVSGRATLVNVEDKEALAEVLGDNAAAHASR